MSPTWKVTCAALAAFFIIIGTKLAFSHDAPSGWTYPYVCCSSYDCRPVDGPDAHPRHHEIQITKGDAGYIISTTGEVIPFGDKRIKNIAPDGAWHWCSLAGSDTGKTLCILKPPDLF